VLADRVMWGKKSAETEPRHEISPGCGCRRYEAVR
jgi:hypothetical protein